MPSSTSNADGVTDVGDDEDGFNLVLLGKMCVGLTRSKLLQEALERGRGGPRCCCAGKLDIDGHFVARSLWGVSCRLSDAY